MDLKFTFGGSKNPDSGESPAQTAGAATDGVPAGGIPLPFSTAPASTSTVLEVQVRLSTDLVIAEAVSGDGVTYGRSEVPCSNPAADQLALCVRSAVSRVVAELAEPVRDSVTAVTLDLGGAEGSVAAELDVEHESGDDVESSRVLGRIGDALQRRTGLAPGTPITAA